MEKIMIIVIKVLNIGMIALIVNLYKIYREVLELIDINEKKNEQNNKNIRIDIESLQIKLKSTIEKIDNYEDKAKYQKITFKKGIDEVKEKFNWWVKTTDSFVINQVIGNKNREIVLIEYEKHVYKCKVINYVENNNKGKFIAEVIRFME